METPSIINQFKCEENNTKSGLMFKTTAQKLCAQEWVHKATCETNEQVYAILPKDAM